MKPNAKSSLVFIAVALVPTACGGTPSESTVATSDASTIIVTSSDKLTFDPHAVTVAAGSVHLVHRNDGAIVHTLVLDGTDMKLIDDEDETIDLAVGEYVYFCDVPGHREAGMEGLLTVTAP